MNNKPEESIKLIEFEEDGEGFVIYTNKEIYWVDPQLSFIVDDQRNARIRKEE